MTLNSDAPPTTVIVLVGGPAGLDRIRHTAGADVGQRVVVDYYGRHEHFECTGDIDVVAGCVAPVFQWSYSTKIAE